MSTKKYRYTVSLTLPEINHLLHALDLDGGYYGDWNQYLSREERIKTKLRECLTSQIPADGTIDGDGFWFGGKWHMHKCGLNPDPKAMKHMVNYCTCSMAQNLKLMAELIPNLYDPSRKLYTPCHDDPNCGLPAGHEGRHAPCSTPPKGLKT